MSLAVSALVLAGVALAQEPERSAPPVPESDAGVQPPPAGPERPLAVPARVPPPVTPARLQSLRRYRSGRLELREETELRGGSAWLMGGGYGAVWGPGYGGWGWSGPVIIDPPTAVKTWGIYRGPERLDVPEFLTAVGADAQRVALQDDIARLERRGRVWSGVAAVGGAGLVTGLVMMSAARNAQDWQHYQSGNSVSFASTLVIAGGFIGSSFPRGRASALRRQPSSTMGGEEAQAMVDAHNETLRRELGLSAADVWALEAQ